LSARLPPVAGEWIDRSRPVAFEFEGRRYQGFSGDTISSALLAAGVRVLGRSFKYHRPRGPLSFANHDANALAQSGGTPNVRADLTPLREGMRLVAVNTFGGLQSDRGRLLDWLSPFLPVGFYYKAFYSKRWFPTWERMFRRLGGLGRVDTTSARITTPKRYDFCDVLVVGGGPSGMTAALAAADAGAKVVLVDENARLGGSGLYSLGADASQRATIEALVRRAEDHPALSVRCETVAAGYYADHWVPLVDEVRMTKLRARAVVVCSGAFEQPAVFRNNDRPGVMLASAAQRLIYRYAVRPFRRAVVLAANADAYRAALDLTEHGIEVAAIVDLRPDGEHSPLATEAMQRKIPVHAGHFIYSAHGKELGSVEIGRLGGGGDTIKIACDGVAMAVGYAPAAALLYQAGAPIRYAQGIEQFVPADFPPGVFAAGRVNGVYGLESRLRDGQRAGLEAARFLGFGPASSSPAVPPEHSSPSHAYPIFAHPRGKNFVDFDEDVVLADLHNAAQEGFDSIELLKRFTTIGMGLSQGKHSNMNAARVLARIRGESVAAVGTPTARPFFHPVRMAVLSGRGFHAERTTPLHGRHEALGAKFMPAGQWWRPEYYRVEGTSREQCIRDEALAVRQAVGVIDVGTLGKIEITGPGAAEFLERVYTGRFGNLRSGMTRYGLMVDESGVIIDDGVIARLGSDRFYFTTTTSGSATVYRELTRLNTVWRLECAIVNVTGHLGALNLAGPKSRQVLAQLTRSDLSEGAFPYLAVRELEIAGVPARAMRVGFVGELGYEIHIAADRTGALSDALIKAGLPVGIRPFGVEAQRLLRLEKGHIIVGQDTDGLTTPVEAGCAWAVKMDKPFFIGQRSLRIIQKKPLRQMLVGFELPSGEQSAKVLECHLAIDKGEIAGRVTSVAWSPTLAKHIGMAMLSPSLAREGTSFTIRVTDGTTVEACVVTTPFYDADGRRQKLAEAA
jgi:sarcosine oxidase subunit alpha